MMGGYRNYDRKLKEALSASDVAVEEPYIMEVGIEFRPVILIVKGGSSIVMIKGFNHLGLKNSFCRSHIIE